MGRGHCLCLIFWCERSGVIITLFLTSHFNHLSGSLVFKCKYMCQGHYLIHYLNHSTF